MITMQPLFAKDNRLRTARVAGFTRGKRSDWVSDAQVAMAPLSI